MHRSVFVRTTCSLLLLVVVTVVVVTGYTVTTLSLCFRDLTGKISRTFCANYRDRNSTFLVRRSLRSRKERLMWTPRPSVCPSFSYEKFVRFSRNSVLFGTLCVSVPSSWEVKGPVEMEQCSETSAYKIQTSGNHPKEIIQQSLNKSINVLLVTKPDCSVPKHKSLHLAWCSRQTALCDCLKQTVHGIRVVL